ncbi:hypothetical protein SprV_0401709300 [Sparganum proliferum]
MSRPPCATEESFLQAAGKHRAREAMGDTTWQANGSCAYPGQSFATAEIPQSLGPDPSETLVHDLSSKELTPVQLQVLQHAACFNTADADPVNLLAGIESVLKHSQEPDDAKHLIRQQVTSLLLAHKPRVAIPKAEQDALERLKADRSVVVRRRSDEEEINTTLARLQSNGAISKAERLAIKPTDSAMARFYGLPKIHKPDAPLRPIVYLRGTPTSNLAKWLFRRLNCLTSGSDTTVRSAVHFLERLQGLHLNADEVMVSFDVTSLFTSIPQSLAIETVGDLLRSQYDDETSRLKRGHLIQMLNFCLITYFSFEGTVYEQIKGTPMGSPLSGFIAEAVLQKLETLVFATHRPIFWARLQHRGRASSDFIAALEATLSKTKATEDAKNSIRQRVASLIISHRPRQTISSAEVKAIKELKRDEETVIVPADKGRATVILDKSEYVAKAPELLNDDHSYNVIDYDPMKTLVAKINKRLNLMRNLQAISENDWRQMKPQYAAIAGFHGLPKTHKPNVPLRLIVAMKGPPTYGLD